MEANMKSFLVALAFLLLPLCAHAGIYDLDRPGDKTHAELGFMIGLYGAGIGHLADASTGNFTIGKRATFAAFLVGTPVIGKELWDKYKDDGEFDWTDVGIGATFGALGYLTGETVIGGFRFYVYPAFKD